MNSRKRIAPALLCLISLSCVPIQTQAQDWQPHIGNTWQWQLGGTVNTGYEVEIYDIDLFDTSAETITALHEQGRRIVCYFSAGSAENWRDDFVRFAGADMGNPLDGWVGERWLDTRSGTVRAIMIDRLDLAKTKGCDGVEPDNVDGYRAENDADLPLTRATQIDYAEFLVSAAHARGLAIGLKNDINNVAGLAALYDFAINEECHAYDECGVYRAFTKLGKPVFNSEYADRFVTNEDGARDRACTLSKQLRLADPRPAARAGRRLSPYLRSVLSSFSFLCPAVTSVSYRTRHRSGLRTMEARDTHHKNVVWQRHSTRASFRL